MKYQCYGQVVGSKYLGEVEAENEKQALELAADLESAQFVSICHQCSDSIEDAEIREIVVQKVE